MSTTRLPELPPLPVGDDWNEPMEMRRYAHAYGLAVWKAAMEAAAKEADDFAEMMESGAGYVKPGYRLRQLARTLRSLPLPESDMTQARGE